jgi:hypothetical protein
MRFQHTAGHLWESSSSSLGGWEASLGEMSSFVGFQPTHK